MVQVRRYTNLRKKSFGAQNCAEFAVEYLDRDIAIVPDVAGQINGSHSSGANLAQDFIAAGQSVIEFLRRVHLSGQPCKSFEGRRRQLR